jgi:hypothetical protein
VLAMAVFLDLEIKQIDADTIFLNPKSDTNIYVELPPRWMEMGLLLIKEDVTKLLKALYGLKQAPRLWQQFLATALLKLGFELLKSDDYIYYNSDTKIIIVMYIDNFLIISRSIPKINQLKATLAKKFSIKELGPAQYFVEV